MLALIALRSKTVCSVQQEMSQGREVGLALDLQVMVSISHCSRHRRCLVSISGNFCVERKHILRHYAHRSFQFSSTWHELLPILMSKQRDAVKEWFGADPGARPSGFDL